MSTSSLRALVRHRVAASLVAIAALLCSWSVSAAPADTAQNLLSALSAHVSKTADPAPASLSPELLGTTAGKLAEKLKDANAAGEAIHRLRRDTVVPMKSVTWRPMAELKDDKGQPKGQVLTGHVTVTDGRHGVVAVEFDKDGKITQVRRAKFTEISGKEVAQKILEQLKGGKAAEVWAAADEELKKGRTLEAFVAELKSDHFDEVTTFAWGKHTDFEGGFRLNGTMRQKSLKEDTPFYLVLVNDVDGLKLLDIQSTTSFMQRVMMGTADTLDISLLVVALGLLLGFLYIIFSYSRGLKGSPRELYILFFTKVTEYSAYGAAQICFMFYLREDLGMSDIGAGSYYSVWSTGLTLLTMLVGAFCDAIGIKRTLLVGSVALLISRAIMPFSENVILSTIFGFVPLAVGIAITGPVLSVGIKRYTTREGAALGFGLFYTLMNVGWAIGAWLFDYMRINIGDGSVNVLGSELSAYQAIIGIGFFINLPDLAAILWMRRGIERTETGVKVEVDDSAVVGMGPIEASLSLTKKAFKDTVKIFSENFVQKAFWVFLALIGMTVFARLTFFHFHITWPTYGSRYFGAGSLIGNIFGVLNPVMIVFLVPVFAFITRKVSSYKMLLVGTIVSVASVLLVVVPVETFAGLENSWFGTIIFDRWLEVPVGRRDPYYLSMVLFVIAFTIGEAIWSPRLMQFTAEIAPPGREGSYVALAYLPYFGAKLVVGPMAGWLLTSYTPEFGIGGQYMNYPDHQSIWLWVGGTAAITPIALVLMRRLYREAEERAAASAEAASAQEAAEAAEAAAETAAS